MRKAYLVLLAIFMTVFLTGMVSAQINRFEGQWKNVNPNDGGITSIVITSTRTVVRVHVWGKCTPSDCDWGEVTGYAYGDNVGSNVVTSARSLSATYKTSFSEAVLVIRLAGGSRIQVQSFTRFTDNSGRSAYQATDVFARVEPELSGAPDCLTYNPRNLQILNEGANGWLLTDGASRMHMLDNRGDAERALALAQRYTAHCFIGRGNTSPNRKNFIVEYWAGNSGISTTINNEDCIAYNRSNLRIVDEGANGWLLTDGQSRILMLANREDATRALDLARKNTRQCFIGRNNTRPNRQDYIFEYWR